MRKELEEEQKKKKKNVERKAERVMEENKEPMMLTTTTSLFKTVMITGDQKKIQTFLEFKTKKDAADDDDAADADSFCLSVRRVS